MLKKFILNKLLLHKKNTFYEHDSDFIIYKNDDISKEIMINGLYEKNILPGLIKNIFPKLNLKKNLIDIGSNIGNHSVFFSKFFNLIFSFEPVARNFKILEINTEGKKNIKVFNYGCSNIRKDAYCNVKLKNNYGNYSIINKKSALGEKVKLQKLDNLVLKNKIKNIGVIKIDVEGHEFEVFEGAVNTLKNMSPLLLFESDFKDNNFRVIKLLQENDYKYFYEFRFLSISHHPILSQLKIIKLRFIFLLLLKIFFNKKYYDLLIIKKFENRMYPMIIGSKKSIIN